MAEITLKTGGVYKTRGGLRARVLTKDEGETRYPYWGLVDTGLAHSILVSWTPAGKYLADNVADDKWDIIDTWG